MLISVGRHKAPTYLPGFRKTTCDRNHILVMYHGLWSTLKQNRNKVRFWFCLKDGNKRISDVQWLYLFIWLYLYINFIYIKSHINDFILSVSPWIKEASAVIGFHTMGGPLLQHWGALAWLVPPAQMPSWRLLVGTGRMNPDFSHANDSQIWPLDLDLLRTDKPILQAFMKI